MEWAFKYFSRRCRSVRTRQEALEALMRRERWTSNSPPACEVPLEVEYMPTRYNSSSSSSVNPSSATDVEGKYDNATL